ncbi:MAG TPA: ABC transporter substrate-binding protein, partial [Burkholderiaceae bacterium]|nr:ABC transporter substrate-binding protein [Burkholderiaceae bacterium]
MLGVPAYVVLGESLASLPAVWMPHVVAMGAAYLAVATVAVLVRPGRTLLGVLDIVAVTISVYGVALVLLSARPDIPVSRQVVTFSILLALFLALLPMVLQRRRVFGFVIQALLVLAVSGLWNQTPNGIPLLVAFGDSRSLSKVPFVIAYEQGLFEKYGLDVTLWIPPEEGESEIAASQGGRPQHPDIFVDGHSPLIYRMVTEANFPAMLALAGGDCVTRNHIIGKPGLERLEDLKGKRLGINRYRSTTGFVARLLARRMGWDPTLDISILEFGRDVESLKSGLVDAIVANERSFARLQKEGYPVLANTREWGEPLAGNSVMVERQWLSAPGNRDVALRFLKGSAEGFAVFHQHPEVARQVMAKWNRHMGDDLAETVYDRGDSFPRKPYPCYEGVKKTMEIYDSNEMRRFAPEHFYDDSLMRELDD